MDLSTYVRIGRYDLPEPTRTTAPANNLLAQEVSAVTYNKDTDTLFVVGDGGTSITQVSKTGQFINTMTLAPNAANPQGVEFYDPEGLTYIGGGKFVMVEERNRVAVEFTYVANTTLQRADTLSFKLGTTIGNVGLEGLSYDPQTSGFIFVKESGPQGVIQTTIDFAAGTASNGSPMTVNSTNLFDPAKAGTLDFADVFALSNIPAFAGTDVGNILLLSQESGKIVEVDRMGNVLSSLTIVSDIGNPISVPDQQHEGMTMDSDGYLYVVSENGGGDINHPQLWVYAASTGINAAPTAITLANTMTAVEENTSTVARIKVADVVVTDDSLGTNTFSVTGADAAFFDADSTGLYIKAGTVIDFETKASYSVTVNVDDASLGATPDASTNYTLSVTDVINENVLPTVYISEVAPWSSGNSPFLADWFEVTNGGSSTLNITGWKMDDNSNSFASSVALNGVTSIAAGASAIFIETSSAATITAFINTWFGGTAPAGVQIGSYSGSGVGLSTGGDAVNLYNAAGTLQANVTFGNADGITPYQTFNNAAGLNNASISALSMVGVNGAFKAVNDVNEIGSPGTVGKLIISEVAPWSSGNSPVGADWFEVTNTTAQAINIAGWKVDDNSQTPAAAVALNGITTIGAGESVIFLESANLAGVRTAFINNWFGGNAPANLQIGSYSGAAVGLSTNGDQVNLYDGTNVLRASVAFGASPSGPNYPTFDNAAGINTITTPLSTLSVVGTNAAFSAINDTKEIGSPGEIFPINDAPIAGDDTLTSILENSGARTISFASLLANDLAGSANEASQTLTITQVTNAVGGTVSIVGTDVIFTPGLDFSGTASFDYTVQDNGQTNGVNAFRTDTASVNFGVTFVDQAPGFTSPANFPVAENNVVAAALTADDREDTALTFAIAGGADQALFTIDQDTGVISFVSAPDFETPEDAGHDNGYALDVTVTDSFGHVVSQSVAISVTDVVETGQSIGGDDTGNTLGGTTGNDKIKGADGDDQISGGDGNDKVFGGNDNDQVLGGRGNDLIFGEAGDDIIDGGAGIDNLQGGAGEDIITGGSGADRLDGGDDADSLFGGAGGDYLIGGAGDDILNGGADRDGLLGGIGADRFVFSSVTDSTAAARDFIIDFDSAEGDLIDLSGIDAILGGADDAFSLVSAFSGAAGELIALSKSSSVFVSADIDGDAVADFTFAVQNISSLQAADFIL